MNYDKNTPRLLGAAQLFVFLVGILIGTALIDAKIWSGSISDNLVNIADNPTWLRINILGELVSSIGIVVLGALFYIALNKQNKIIALVALGLYWAEAITVAGSKIFLYSLLNVSQEFVKAGAPDSPYFQTLGSSLYESAHFGYSIHMLFFCLGGILWYYLFYRSRYIPRALSVWGLAAVCLLSINVLLGLYDRDVGFVWILCGPYIPYELVLSVWLIVKGFNPSAIASESAKADINEI